MKDLSAIILAAGASTRLGQPKQLLKSNEVPLLLKTVQAAHDAQIENIVVVLGFNYKAHKEIIQQFNVEIVEHAEWVKGMGSSLKAGLTHLLRNNNPSAVIITVCDQPFILGKHLSKLVKNHQETSSAIVASRYNNTLGVPALFDHTFFNELLNVEDNQGAKAVIQKHLNQVAFVDWPEGAIDIDTPDDLRFL